MSGCREGLCPWLPVREDDKLYGRGGFFFFNDTATTEIYTLSLHDALPIRWSPPAFSCWPPVRERRSARRSRAMRAEDRKSTRLNSSHVAISYAVFCLKKKNPPFGITNHQKSNNWRQEIGYQCGECEQVEFESTVFFFFNDTATTEIYTLSLHDALPISSRAMRAAYPSGVLASGSVPSAAMRSCVS